MRDADVILEVPARWFDNPLDSERHQRLYVSFLVALADLDLTVRPVRLPYAADDAPRVYQPGQLVISFHSRGSDRNVMRFKESYWPPYYGLDPVGFSGFSDLAQNPDEYRHEIETFPLKEATGFVDQIAAEARARNQSKYPQPVRSTQTPAAGYVFQPLQTVEDPVATLSHMDQMDVLAKLCVLTARAGTRVVAKRHPLCKSDRVGARLAELDRDFDNLDISQASVHALIEGADVVVGANSGVLFEALVAGARVVSFAKSDFEMATQNVMNLAGLETALADVAGHDPHFQTRFVAWYLTEYCVHAADVETLRGRIATALTKLDIDPRAVNRRQQALFAHYAQIELRRRAKVLSAR